MNTIKLLYVSFGSFRPRWSNQSSYALQASPLGWSPFPLRQGRIPPLLRRKRYWRMNPMLFPFVLQLLSAEIFMASSRIYWSSSRSEERCQSPIISSWETMSIAVSFILLRPPLSRNRHLTHRPEGTLQREDNNSKRKSWIKDSESGLWLLRWVLT
jgi:hypothetical protein